MILFEDLESVGSARTGVVYTPSFADSLDEIGVNDYFGVVNKTFANSSTLNAEIIYTNIQGSEFYGAQDIDSAAPLAPPTSDPRVVLEWNDIDISSFTNLNLSWFVSEDTTSDTDAANSEDWDSTDFFLIEIQMDGMGYSPFFAIEGSGGFNTAPQVDTDFDGIGDGIFITDDFTKFDNGIGVGLNQDIRITFRLNAGDEDLGFDNLLLTGDPSGPGGTVPEPTTCCIFAGVLLIGIGGRRRRNRAA